jgi:alginate O-acetyltransferase complex protein AlgI
MPGDVPFLALVGTILCLLPATPTYRLLHQAYADKRMVYALSQAAILALFVLACARVLAVPFQPFIYFRF